MSEMITRAEARERGLMRYFTGKPCKRGHVAERYVSNRKCIDCERAYREANREKERERVRAYREANPEKDREQTRRRRALQKGQLGHVSPDIEERLMHRQKGKCAGWYCIADLESGRHDYHLDHMVPLVQGGLHDDDNLQLLCQHCNLSKGAQTMIEWKRSLDLGRAA